MKHILFDLKGCPFELLDDEQHIKITLYKTVPETKSELLSLQTHKFEPQGVTGFALLAESHISIHTWPEDGIARCDVFTCGDECEPEKAVEYLAKELGAKSTSVQTYERK